MNTKLYLLIGCHFVKGNVTFVMTSGYSGKHKYKTVVAFHVKDKSTLYFTALKKNPAYGRQSISRPMRIVAPIPQ